MIEIIDNQDLLTLNCNIFCHQVNCQGVMGSGIAKQIKDTYPIVYTEYIEKCKETAHKRNLLGKAQFVELSDGKICANLFGQFYYGYDGKIYTDDCALYCAFMNLMDYCQILINECEYENVIVGIPYKIGCGLGGGDWTKIYKMICEIFETDDRVQVKICKINN